MADKAEEAYDSAMESLGEIEDKLSDIDVDRDDKKQMLDVVAPDYSDSDLNDVHPEDAATHNDPMCFVTEESYNDWEDGKVSREEIGAFPEDDITTHERYTGVLVSLFTPRSRALLIDSWVREGEKPITVTELAESSSDLTRQTVHSHIGPLVELGFIIEAGKKGNAQTYQLNIRNPLVQVVHMMSNLGRFGRTNFLLERDFLVPGPNGESIDHDEKGYKKGEQEE